MRRDQSPPTPMRLTAILAVLLVLALAVCAASPELHERLHHHPAAAGHAESSEEGCVVTLFAQGLLAGILFVLLRFADRGARAADAAPRARSLPDAPEYLHLPPQAPPLGAA